MKQLDRITMDPAVMGGKPVTFILRYIFFRTAMTMPKQIITIQDSLSSTVLQESIEREKQALCLSIGQVEANVAAFERKFGTHDRTSLFGKVDDMQLIEWEGEEETLARLRPRLQRLEEIQVEPQ